MINMAFELFSPELQKLIKEKGFLGPTLPQKIGIPHILKGDDVLIIAPTGSGKTEVACLPLFDKIHKNKDKPISMLYINPLRSLSRDLLDRLVWWADKLDLDISVRHGDVSQKERALQREMPPHILITTPETLGAILTGKKMREHLKNVKYVVIDEIHELITSKRGIQLSLLLERLREVAGDFQRIGLSATVGSPQTVADFLGDKTKIIRAELEKKYDIRVENPKPKSKDRIIADDLAIGPETTARLRKLYELINSHKSVLVFTNTRETAEVLSSRLRQFDRELKQTVHHGSLSKEKRIKSEQEFKKELLKSLIATSSLELGIDIGSIDLVVQYLSPRQVTRLVQRTGRSGHRVGEVSKGIIISGEEDLFESSVIAKRTSEKKLEEIRVHEKAMDVLAGQIVGLCIENIEIRDEKIYRIIKRAYPYRDLEKKDIIKLLKFLSDLRLIYLIEGPVGLKTRRRLRSWKYYFDNLSTIPDSRQYKVISVIENEPIGNLDEGFVAEHGSPGEKFIVSGRAWRIIQVDAQKVFVEPVEDIESAIPAWEGELIPVPFEIAQEIGRLRRSIKNGKLEGFNVSSATEEEMSELIKKHSSSHIIPDDVHFLIENYKDFIILHSCSGSLVNDTLGRYIAALLSEKTGMAVNLKIDPYRIMIQSSAKASDVKEILVKDENIDETLKEAISRSSLFKYRFLQVARRFGIISRNVDYDRINLNKIVSQYENTPCYEETLREVFLDKMDLRNTKLILEKIRKGKIKVEIQEGLSILGELGLVHQFKEIMKPRMPEKEIFLTFKRRLLRTRVRLICVNCGDYNLVKAVREVEEQPECPKCTSRLIAAISKRNVDAVNIVKKKIKKKELTEEEMKRFLTIRRSADLVIVYGKKAVVVLAGHGIGPQTAAYVLAKMQSTKEKLFQDILHAEKEFARTKKYWK